MNLHLRRSRAALTAPTTTPLGHPRSAGSTSSAVVVPLPRTELDLGAPRLTSPFEDWCERNHVSPGQLGAWEAFAGEFSPSA